MRKYLVFALTILALSSMAGVLHAEEEVYWDRSTPPDATISEDAFALDYTVRATKSFGDQEVYDSFLPPEIDSPQPAGVDSGTAAVETPTAAAAPIQPRPTVRSNVLPRGFSQPPAARTPPSPAPAVPQTAPTPAETTPGAEVQSIIPKTETRTSIREDESKRGAAVQATGNEAPVAKKMRWGQVDTQKTEQKSEEKSEQKFQWGRQRQ